MYDKDTNVPIEGALVWLEDGTTTITDSVGHYIFNNAPVGIYTITAIKDGYYLALIMLFVHPYTVMTQNIPLQKITAQLTLDRNRLFPEGGETLGINVHLDKVSKASLSVYNQAGDVAIKNLLNGTFYPGVIPVKWDGKNSFGDTLANDVYTIILRVDDTVNVRKIAVLKGARQ